MRIVSLSFLIAVLCSAGAAQTREEALEKLKDLTVQAEVLGNPILSPDKRDLESAAREKVGVFRLLPRETYDKGFFSVRGGGAYYSFSKESHSYNEIPQIGLEQNFLQVGFYGANYGLLADLGEIPLSDVSRDHKAAGFLLNYEPKKNEPEARAEYRKIGRGVEADGLQYHQRRPAISGHTYILRAISYDEADTLVAFRIKRRDADGSLVIFWKLLENFEKPRLVRADPAGMPGKIAVKIGLISREAF